MKTINDIIDYAVNSGYDYNCTNCTECPKLKWCYINTIVCALNYLYNGEY